MERMGRIVGCSFRCGIRFEISVGDWFRWE